MREASLKMSKPHFDTDELVVYRPLVADDVPFVFSSWLKSYREEMRDVPGKVYFHHHQALIQKLLEKAAVYVAANAEDPSQILGYLACQNIRGVLVVHYLYVKAPFRNHGIASSLLQRARAGVVGIQHSHQTDAGARLMKHVSSVFNPYLAH